MKEPPAQKYMLTPELKAHEHSSERRQDSEGTLITPRMGLSSFLQLKQPEVMS